jgi:hypothetical protein
LLPLATEFAPTATAFVPLACAFAPAAFECVPDDRAASVLVSPFALKNAEAPVSVMFWIAPLMAASN